MKILCVIAFSALCWSCQSKNTSGAPPDTAQTEKRDSASIVLDGAAQQKGHIVVESVQLKDMVATLTIPGRLTVNEDQTWRVGAVASGRVEELFVHLGDLVRSGQILGRIHSHDVHEARAGYQQAQTELERARSAQGYARQRRDRAQRLFDLKAGSRQDLENAEADLRNVQAAIDKAQSELEKERAHLAILRVPTANNEDDDVPILAPAAGVVLDRKVTAGSVVNTGDELLTISDTSILWMIGAANEEDLSALRADQPVSIQARAFPNREFIGRILKLGEHLEQATRTLQIRISVPNPKALLRPEMYVSARVQRSGRRAALVLPEQAIQEIDGVPVVFVRETDNEFRARVVQTGHHADGGIEIVEGLQRGEAVVVKGGFALKSQLARSSFQDQD